MGIFIYSVFLIVFLIPVTIRAYLSVKAGRSPLPHFQNNVVVSRIKTRRALGALSPATFWVFHTLYVVGALAIEAGLAALAAVVYMVVSSMLAAQIKAKRMHVIPEVAKPVDPNP